jgi:isoleucyl-tRNA synthetase
VEKAVNSLEELLEDRLNTKEVEFEEVDLDYEVKLDYSKAGPELGGDVGEVEESLSKSDHREIAEKIGNGETITLSDHDLDSEMFEVRTHVPEGMEGEEFSSGTVYIDGEMTPELEDEAFIAETVRAIQQGRKEAELEVEDTVNLSFSGDTDPIEKHESEIRDRMNVDEISYSGENHSYSGEVEFRGRKVKFSFSEPTA